MAVRFALPSSLGPARAQARGELIKGALESVLGEPVQVEIAADYGDLVGIARAGTADLIWAPSVVCARLEDDAAAVFKSVRSGQTTYRAALIARADAELELTLAKLGGKRAAWVDPTSLGGHLLPVQFLERLGLDARRLFGSERFVGSYPAAVTAVLEKEADLASIFVTDARPEVVDRALGLLVGPARAAKLATLGVTEPVPTDAIVVTNALAEPRLSAIVEKLFPAAQTRARPVSFCLAMEVDGFERAAPGEYAGLRSLWRVT